MIFVERLIGIGLGIDGFYVYSQLRNTFRGASLSERTFAGNSRNGPWRPEGNRQLRGITMQVEYGTSSGAAEKDEVSCHTLHLG